MIKKLCIASTLAASLFSSAALAEGVTLIPRFESGFSSYSLKFNGQVPLDASGNSLQASAQLGDSIFVYRVGLTFAFEAIYVDLMGSGTADFTDVQIIPEFDAIEKWSGDRQEINVTLGYQLFDAGSVFVGYRDGRLEADGQFNSTFTFESDGFYVGMNYGIPITDSGALSFNVAYAFLDAELDQTLFGSAFDTAGGNGNGLKFGLAWQDFLSDTVRYTISLDQYRYKTDADSASGIDIEMTEKESAIRIGISKAF